MRIIIRIPVTEEVNVVAAPRKAAAERKSHYMTIRLKPAEHREVAAASRQLKVAMADAGRAGLRLFFRQNGIKVLGEK